MSAPSLAEAQAALARFATSGALVSLTPYTAGHIHDAWQARFEARGQVARYLLQQINRRVFQRPEQVLANLLRVTRHLRDRLAREGVRDAERRVPGLVPTRDGAGWHVDERGETWRLLPWIEGTRSFERAANARDAAATARAFGLFLRRLGDLAGPPLHATIPGFHDTAARVRALERVSAADPEGRAAACRAEIDALVGRRALATALRAAGEGGPSERPVHNDAKIANLLFDAESGEALAVVDLDTTMPGLAAHDFGDLVRSSVSDSAEDEPDLARVSVRREVFAALAAGFLDGVGDALTPGERGQLVTGARVIVYEQAVRFLADHLDGDRYYRTSRPGHNRDRARAQLALLEALERASPELEELVASAG
jgi:hypothetical protein